MPSIDRILSGGVSKLAIWIADNQIQQVIETMILVRPIPERSSRTDPLACPMIDQEGPNLSPAPPEDDKPIPRANSSAGARRGEP
ncbi:MAG: hypothetical protein OXI01_23645 [Albidovulum sp.]|nr:hypothetical protein [Albidovulum sp.]